MRDQVLEARFCERLEQWFAQPRKPLIEILGSGALNGAAVWLLAVVISSDDRLPIYDPEMLVDLKAHIEELDDRLVIYGTFAGANCQITLRPMTVAARRNFSFTPDAAHVA